MVRFRKNKGLLRVVCLYVAISFFSSAIFPNFIQAQEIILPAPTQFVPLSNAYSFPVLKGLKFDPADPLKMEFIIDTQDKKKVTEEEAGALIKYFLAGLTIPEQDIWVNMSPFEKERMITPELAQTDLGKDLLAQDYILKQISASLTYPESDTGKDFWERTYQEVLRIAKTTNLPVNTFNKIWIVPNEAEVYENGNFALITKASLKVMLEEDYLALKNNIRDIQKKKKNLKPDLIEEINTASSRVVRETILPKINQEVNSGKNFATLRQIYHSLILGMWFKQKFQESVYRDYINKGKLKGIDLADKDAKEKIYNLYIEAFKKGLYNYVKSEYEPGSQRKIKRQYYSGGFDVIGGPNGSNWVKPDDDLSPDELPSKYTVGALTNFNPVGASSPLDSSSPINIGINNPGATEREIIRQWFLGKLPMINIVGVNGVSATELHFLLTKDFSASPEFQDWFLKNSEVIGSSLTKKDDQKPMSISVSEINDPSDLPWKALKAEVVIEGRDPSLARNHLDQGARSVIVSHPAVTAVSALRLVLLVLPKDKISGINFIDVQPPTALQRGLDNSSFSRGDPYLGWAMGANLVPTFAKAIKNSLGALLPDLAEKVSGKIIFSPQALGSLLDIHIVLKEDTDVQSINRLFKEASQKELKGKMTYSEDRAFVSSDLRQRGELIFQAPFTKVIGKKIIHLQIAHHEQTGFALTQLPEIIRAGKEREISTVITPKTQEDISPELESLLKGWVNTLDQKTSQVLTSDRGYIPHPYGIERPRVPPEEFKAIEGINGPGRTGRTAIWAMQGDRNIDLRMINGVASAFDLSRLLAEDSIQQSTPKPVTRLILTISQLRRELNLLLGNYDLDFVKGSVEGLINSGRLVVLEEGRFIEFLKQLLTQWGQPKEQLNEDIDWLLKTLVGVIDLNGKKVLLVNERKAISEIPWAVAGIKTVLECTGDLKNADEASQHLAHIKGGRVLISAPAEGADKSIVLGAVVPSRGRIVDAASCTTNAIAPVAYVLNKEFGVNGQVLTTVHAYTTDQNFGGEFSHKKEPTRGRDARLNALTASTGAAVATGKIIPLLQGKSDGRAIRTPNLTGSFVELTALLKGKVTKEDIRDRLKKASQTYLRGLLAYTQAPLVSSLIIGNPASGIVDGNSIEIISYDPEIDQTMVKIEIWYDNEMGFSNRLVNLSVFMAGFSWIKGRAIGDIGPKTRALFGKLLQDTLREKGTVIWNGPMGVVEVESTAEGTDVMATDITNLPDNIIKVVGGGDTIKTIPDEIRKKMTHVSTGGGAFLEAFKDGVENLPGIQPLIDASTGKLYTLDDLLGVVKPGDTVIIREDYNVSLDSKLNIVDNTRIRESLPTIKELLARGVKIVLMTHLGRPGGKVDPLLKTDPLAKELNKLLPNVVIHKLNDSIGERVKDFIQNNLKPGQILHLENLRFTLGEEQNSTTFAYELSELADYYVDDAFAATHRAHASIEGITKFFSGKKFAGRLLEKEVIRLQEILRNPQPPLVVVLGGGKVTDKIHIINALKDRAELFLIGGRMAIAFMAAKGINVGDSAPDEIEVVTAKELLKDPGLKDKIVLPEDSIVVDDTATGENPTVINGDVQPSDISELTQRFAAYLDSYLPAMTAEGKAQASSPLRQEALQRAVSAKRERTPVIGGNWKMEINDRGSAVNLAQSIGSNIKSSTKNADISNVEIVIAPSLTHLRDVLKKYNGAPQEWKLPPIKFAAQNMYAEEKGALTGGTSAAQLKEAGATYVILGHSEVRRNSEQEPTGESSRNVNKKVKTALANGLIPVVAVGESDLERTQGKTQEIVGTMVRESLDGLSAEEAAKVIVAYEPVWAIGTGKNATPQQAEEIHLFIRGILLDMFGEEAASKIRIIYGGSVKPDNIAGLISEPNIDGALVGGASLNAESFAKIIESVAAQSSSPIIRTELTVPEGQKPGFFTSDYQGYMISELFANPVEQIPDAVVNAVRRKLKKDMAEGKILSAEVDDYGASEIGIQVTHRFGELNAAIQRLMMEAIKEGALKVQGLGLLKKDINIASMSVGDLALNLRVKREQYSITERGSETFVRVKLIGASISAGNIKLFHQFFVSGATPLKALGFLPIVDTKKKDKLPVRGFRAVVRRLDDVLKGKLDGDVWEFEKSSAAEIDGVKYPSVDESDELEAMAGQPNDFVITEIYAVEGSLVSSTEPLVKVVFQPVYGEKGNLRTLNPTFLCRSQSGADAVAGVASMFYDVNFVPGGNNGEHFVATMPVTKKEARKAPPEGIAYVVVDGWQFKGNGIIPQEKDGVIDHVAINPPAFQPERRLAKWLASIMTTHKKDQPYIAPFAAEAQVESLRKAQSHLFKRAPKEADIDPVMNEVEAKVESGEFISFDDDKADMGGKDGHSFTPEYMLAIDRASQIEAIERGEMTDGNIIGFVEKGRLKNGTTNSIGDDGHIISLGDKSRNAANSHQSSFVALTRGYLASMVGNRKDFDPAIPLNTKEAEEKAEKPYGRAQDYAGKEAKAAKANPYFYSRLNERFFEILREVMPLDYMQMVENMRKGWKYWQEHGTTGVLLEPFSGNVSSQGMGTARYLVDIANGEREVGILAGDKNGPAALNRPIREGVDTALAAGEFKNGLVYEIWDAKAFDEHGNIPIDELPEFYVDIADSIDELKDASDQALVKSFYTEDGLIKTRLTIEDKKKLAALIKESGFVPTKRIYLDAQRDKAAVDLYLADSDRFNIKQVWSKKTARWDINNFRAYLDRPILGSSVTKLGILAGGEYIGKDDPVMVGSMKLMKHIFEFLKTNPLIIQGDMNGSHWLAAIPTAFKYAVANKESHPILVGMVYTLSEDGKTLANVEDVFGKKEYAPIRNKMFKFNFEFKRAQLGGQFEPYGTNWRTIEAAYPKNKLLRQLQDPRSPFLIRNKSPESRKLRPITMAEATAELFKVATAASPLSQEATPFTITPEIAYDSRGKPTVQVKLKMDDMEVTGDVPAGASKGEDEAHTVGVQQAIKNISGVIVPLLNNSGLEPRDHQGLIAMERLMIEKAGDNFKDLGADAVVPVSRALWKMAAELWGMGLWHYIRNAEPRAVSDRTEPVYFFMNIYNGGLHALKEGEELGKDRIDIQEIMVVPVSAKSYRQAVQMGDKIDFELKNILLENFEKDTLSRADEQGFSLKGLGDSTGAIGYVFEAIKRAGYEPGKDVKLALDVAASSFYKEGKYQFQGKELDSDGMIAYYLNLADQYAGKIILIEDGLAENDWQGWQKLTKEMKKRGIRIMGDDLFVSQLRRLNKGIEMEAATDILIKVNQNGTMLGTLEVIKRAKQAGMGWVVSHRSGETLDDSIADLAYATNALGLKSGDPQPDYDFGVGGAYHQPLVRRVKYQRMIDIEKSVAQEKMTRFYAWPRPGVGRRRMTRGYEFSGSAFDLRLKQGDETVIEDIVEFYDTLSRGYKQLLYEWLQHHESALAANVLAKIGLNWPDVVWRLTDTMAGSMDGNRHAAARQLEELANEGTYGGLSAPREVINEARGNWRGQSHFHNLVEPVKIPEFPKLQAEKPGTLVLVRHGETSWSEAVLNKWAGWHDVRITEKGRQEAFIAGEQLKSEGLSFDKGYSSDLSRAIDTLSEVLKALGQTDIPVVEDKALRERNYGDMIGWRRTLAEGVFGKDQFTKWRRGYSGNDVRPPGGENLADVQERTLPFAIPNIFGDIAKGENIVVSAHGNSLRSILVHLREHTTGKKLTEEEIIGLEVPLAAPIVITFDNQLRVDSVKGPAHIIKFLKGETTMASSAITTDEESEPDFTRGSPDFPKGGIDLQGINVKAAPASSPMNIPMFDFQNLQGLTFQIIKIESIPNLNAFFGIVSEEKKGERDKFAQMKN